MPFSFADCWDSVMDKTAPDDSKVHFLIKILPHPAFIFSSKITNQSHLDNLYLLVQSVGRRELITVSWALC